MNRSRFMMAAILAALMGNGSCAPKSDLIRLPVREAPAAEPKSGYLKIGDQEEQITYIENDGVALLDECARVPMKAVTPEPMASMNLTTHVGVGLWPQAIVPYAIEGAPEGFHENFMRVAIDQYRRAGILLVPRTNQAHYVTIIFLVKNTPKCQSLGCDGYLAAANSYGFTSKANTDWLYFDKNPIHDGNTVFLTCKSAKCDEYTFNLKSYIKPKNKTPKKVAKAKKNWRDVVWRNSMYIVLHEIGHVLGARHEHAHPDAPNAVTSLPTVSFESGGLPVGPFDVHSVMLYCHSFREINSQKPAICSLTGKDYPSVLSDGDVSGFKKLYAKQILLRQSNQPGSIEVVNSNSFNPSGVPPAAPSGPISPPDAPPSDSNYPIPPPSGISNLPAGHSQPGAPVGSSSQSLPASNQGNSSNPTASKTCQKFSRTPVNGGDGDCGDACQSQLKLAAQSLDLSIPDNLVRNAVAFDFYMTIRAVGSRRGCDPLDGTKYR